MNSSALTLTQFLSTDPYYTSDQSALSSVSPNASTKIITVSSVVTVDQMYDKLKSWLAESAQMSSVPVTPLDPSGKSLSIKSGWGVNFTSTGGLTTGTKMTQIALVDGGRVSIASGATVSVPYSDADGIRATVTSLDPQGFGITWHLRYKLQSDSTWTTTSGTGNTTLLLLTGGTYDVQVRVPGYDWKTTTLNTATSLLLDLGLAYHLASDGTPQYTQTFSAALEAIFSYDAATTSVAVANATGSILSPGFAELYQATQRIMHLPSLVWVWSNPVKANSTSQKIIIPTGNPISMYLTNASTASVTLTCPVIHEDTQSSAEDRVKGNTAGYFIKLGNAATAESAGLTAAIISALGGPSFDGQTHGLSIIHALSAAIKAQTDNLPAQPAAVGSAMTLTSAYDSAKTAASHADVVALSTQVGQPLQTASYTAPDNASIAAIKTKTDALHNTDISALPTLAQIESSTVLAKESTVASRASQTSVTALGAPLQSQDYTAPPSASSVASAVRTELSTELYCLDATVSSRSTLTASDIPEGLTADEVWASATRTLTEPAGLTTAQAEQLRKVAHLHGIGAQLAVTETSRIAGDVSQTITTDDDGNTTVSAA